MEIVLWDELAIPITDQAERTLSEESMLACVERHTTQIRQMSEPALETFRQPYHLLDTDPVPKGSSMSILEGKESQRNVNT